MLPSKEVAIVTGHGSSASLRKKKIHDFIKKASSSSSTAATVAAAAAARRKQAAAASPPKPQTLADIAKSAKESAVRISRTLNIMIVNFELSPGGQAGIIHRRTTHFCHRHSLVDL